MKKIIKESGLRDINKLAERYKTAKIYFHQDLDGVTTAIAMKKYLEDNGIKVVDAHVIQYGDKEWAIQKAITEELSEKIDFVLNEIRKILLDAGYNINGTDEFNLLELLKKHINQTQIGDSIGGDIRKSESLLNELKFLLGNRVMPVLVDFAHGKPMFVIHTDHHDSQAGADETKSTSFRSSRSNVETISQVVSPRDIFPDKDILLISTVDSANFAMNDISVDQVINYLFKLDKDSSLEKNKMALGLVANKLLLAFKNKPGFLEELVMRCTPSLMNILQNIKRIMVEKGYTKIPELEKNKEAYINQMKTNPNVKLVGNVIVQYGGGNMMKPGSYDRYTPFKNNPEADFIVIAWPLGLVQASCNPYKKERELKGVNLGEIAQEVLSKWEGSLKEREVPLSSIKWISERSKGFGSESVGFKFKDFVALYGSKYKTMDNGKETLTRIGKMMEKPFTDLSDEEKEMLDKITINAWDLIQANSGGHKDITNISGLSYLGRSKRPPAGAYKYDSESEDSPYVKFTKMIQSEFVKVLQNKINNG